MVLIRTKRTQLTINGSLWKKIIYEFQNRNIKNGGGYLGLLIEKTKKKTSN